MITRADLNRYQEIGVELKRLERKMSQLRDQAQAPRATILTGMPRGKGAESDSLASYAARADELICQHEALREEQADLRRAIEGFIAALEFPECQLIQYRYLEGVTWERISLEMHYSERQLQRILARLLEQIEAA